jgi:sugar phosphate permease
MMPTRPVQTKNKTGPGLALTLQIFVPFAGGYFLSYLFRTVNAVISTDLTQSFGLSSTNLGMLTSAYFISFASFQLPLGVLLDRFGPRRVESVLLVFAGLGAIVFALADDLTGLILGRCLIGFGVSACLMASFKAFTLWFPRERLPLVNGCIMAAGGLGALSATAPVEALLGLTDWRGLFLGLAASVFVVAGLILIVVPEHPGVVKQERFAAQLGGVGRVFRDRYFWLVAPLTVSTQATALAIQGLWIGPFLRDAVGLPRETAANYLLATAFAMVTGFLFLGGLSWRLSRLGVAPIRVAVSGMCVFMLVQSALLLGFGRDSVVVWMAFGFFSTTGILTYAVMSQHFPAYLAGRVNTALNLLVFMGAFAAQWGIGFIIGLWPRSQSGSFAAEGYQSAFALMLILQLLAFVWFAYFRNRFQKAA